MGTGGEAVSFNPIISDVDGWVTKVLWDFGDGTTSTGKKPVHIFEGPGEYTVRITLIDNQGKRTEATTMAVIAQKEDLKFPVLTSIAIFSIFSTYFMNRKYNIIDI